MSSMIMVQPGLLTTVQDRGRRGYAAQGYRTCGAVDSYAYQLGNALLGNPADAASLEFTLQGGSIRFTEDTLYAITGADVSAAVDDIPVSSYAAHWAPAGSTLRIGMAAQGLRIYLAVGGGITTPLVLGSRATDLKCHLGGYEGRALRQGDELPIGYDIEQVSRMWGRLRARRMTEPLSDPVLRTGTHLQTTLQGITVPCLRAVAGPQEAAFTEAGLHTFCHSVYTLTPDCDRMACKLTGDAIEMVRGADIVSDGIAAGSVQISANGQPIVMLADHQTTGGYAKIATVIRADLPVLAQLRPGQRIAFMFITPEEAVSAARQQAAQLQRIRDQIRI